MIKPKSLHSFSLNYFKACFSTSNDHPVLYQYHNNTVKVVLHRPKALNALNLEMINALLSEMEKWKQNPNIKATIFTGSGTKAFCSGGDIKRMHNERGTHPHHYYAPFFRGSYILYDWLATMKTKQIVFWDGIVIGGGVGMSINAPIRIATEKAIFSMPEAKLGLNSNIGGGYYFSRMRNNLGQFIALTGYQLKGPELFQCGLANFYVKHSKLHSLEQELFAKITKDTKIDEIKEIVKKYHEPVDPNYKHEGLIKKVFGKPTIEEILFELENANEDVEFSKEILDIMRSNSPFGTKIIFEQLKRGKDLDLRENFKMDMRSSMKLMYGQEFFECAKAVVTKDKHGGVIPNWKYKRIQDVPDSEVQEYFERVSEDLELNFP